MRRRGLFFSFLGRFSFARSPWSGTQFLSRVFHTCDCTAPQAARALGAFLAFKMLLVPNSILARSSLGIRFAASANGVVEDGLERWESPYSSSVVRRYSVWRLQPAQ